MQEYKTKPDPVRVYQVLCDILSRRGQFKYTLLSVVNTETNEVLYSNPQSTVSKDCKGVVKHDMPTLGSKQKQNN